MAAGNERAICAQIEVLVEGAHEDNGHLWGRSQWDAPDVDPIVFLAESPDPAVARLEPGQIRTCLVKGTSVSDLEAIPV
jgi:ribosomal protein S12 methylthiotransferase